MPILPVRWVAIPSSNPASPLRRPVSCGCGHHELTDAQLHQVAPAQHAVGYKVQEDEVTDPLLSFQVEMDPPHLLGLEGRFGPYKGAL